MIVADSMGWVMNKLDVWVSGSNAGLPREDFNRDPYRSARILRERGSVLRSYSDRGWVALGFDEVQTVLQDRRFYSDLRKNKFVSGLLRMGAGDEPVLFLEQPTMLSMDAPDHTRLRKLAQQGFLHKFILSLEPRIEQIVEECLGDSGETFNVVEDLAKPLPAIVIAELLGLPQDDRQNFQQLSHDLLGITEVIDRAKVKRGIEANNQLRDYFARVIEEKRASPGQDFISQMIVAEDEGDRLTADEMLSTFVLLLIAGHETTTRLIGTGTWLLLKHPDQLELLRNDPGLIPNAIEEMLRYEPPVQAIPRFVAEDMEFAGRKLKKNQVIMPSIASANRDPDANPDPEKFDVQREEIRHVSFGHGPHLCLGMTLARLEAKVAFRMLLDQFPAMTLANEDVGFSTALTRGLSRLVINTNR